MRHNPNVRWWLERNLTKMNLQCKIQRTLLTILGGCNTVGIVQLDCERIWHRLRRRTTIFDPKHLWKVYRSRHVKLRIERTFHWNLENLEQTENYPSNRNTLNTVHIQLDEYIPKLSSLHRLINWWAFQDKYKIEFLLGHNQFSTHHHPKIFIRLESIKNGRDHNWVFYFYMIIHFMLFIVWNQHLMFFFLSWRNTRCQSRSLTEQFRSVWLCVRRNVLVRFTDL